MGAGATKANSGIIHGGYDDKPHSVKAQFCRAGNRMYQKLAQELGFGIQWRGSLVLAFNEEERVHLQALQRNGVQNGVDDTRIIEKDELRERESEVSEKAVCALYCPSAATVAPFEVAFAAAEQSARYGAEYKLEEQVLDLHKGAEHFSLETDKGCYSARFVVNAAGLFSDVIARMVGIDTPSITPKKGEYLVYDRSVKKSINHIMFQTPTKAGKGILVTPTYAGNIMIGSNAVPTGDREDCSVDVERLKGVIASAALSVPFIADIDISKIIRAYAGLRATSSTRDFVIDTQSVPRFVSFVGIQSPGLTSAPALGLHALRALEGQGLVLQKRERIAKPRVGIANVPRQSYMSPSQAAQAATLPEGEPQRIVCRCEQVCEETIMDALARPVPLVSLDAVKRRTRAGMGACQGAFCAPRVRALIARAYTMPASAVTQESTRNTREIKHALKNAR